MIAEAAKTTATAAIATTVLCCLIPLTMYSGLDARVGAAPENPPDDLDAGGTDVEIPAVVIGISVSVSAMPAAANELSLSGGIDRSNSVWNSSRCFNFFRSDSNSLTV